jgi:ligand-binding SRPBCC domain-containing protein
MPIFSKSVIIHAPVELVFAFHEREDALELLSQAFPPLKVIRKSGGISKGARVEVTVGPWRWVALHTAYDKNRLFVDEQIEGPFSKWVHRHEFEGVNASTRLTDHVEFRIPGGNAGNLLLGWAIKLGLSNMFRQRHEVTRAFCEQGT